MAKAKYITDEERKLFREIREELLRKDAEDPAIFLPARVLAIKVVQVVSEEKKEGHTPRKLCKRKSVDIRHSQERIEP